MLTRQLINQIKRVLQGTSFIFFVHLFPGPLSSRRQLPSPLLLSLPLGFPLLLINTYLLSYLMPNHIHGGVLALLTMFVHS